MFKKKKKKGEILSAFVFQGVKEMKCMPENKLEFEAVDVTK